MVVLFAVNSMHRLAIQKKGHPVGPTLRLYLGDSSTAIQEKPPKPPFPKKAYLSEGRENTGTAWEKTPAVKRTLQASTKSSKDILLITIIDLYH